jgi:hypothetical protein
MAHAVAGPARYRTGVEIQILATGYVSDVCINILYPFMVDPVEA